MHLPIEKNELTKKIRANFSILTMLNSRLQENRAM